jgi:hypothetical protein
MVTFKDYLLEYASKEKSKFFGISKMKSGLNGKDWNNPHGRKHANTIAKTYKHKHPIVDRVVQGQANNVPVSGSVLDQILGLYDTDFDIGKKSLGNSVEITMSTDNKGNPKAIISKKVKQNGL